MQITQFSRHAISSFTSMDSTQQLRCGVRLFWITLASVVIGGLACDALIARSRALTKSRLIDDVGVSPQVSPRDDQSELLPEMRLSRSDFSRTSADQRLEHASRSDLFACRGVVPKASLEPVPCLVGTASENLSGAEIPYATRVVRCETLASAPRRFGRTMRLPHDIPKSSQSTTFVLVSMSIDDNLFENLEDGAPDIGELEGNDASESQIESIEDALESIDDALESPTSPSQEQSQSSREPEAPSVLSTPGETLKERLDRQRRINRARNYPKNIRRRVTRINLAQYKALLASKIGIANLLLPYKSPDSRAPLSMRHVGRKLGLGGGFAEGSGFSRHSARAALAMCSFSENGWRVRSYGVAKGRDGYYAYKIYGY